MKAMTAVSTSPAQTWRAYCQQHADRFASIEGTAAARKKIERWEEQRIEGLLADNCAVTDKAVAFRSIVELRRATARDVATFFNVDPQIVVLGLSLLELTNRIPQRVSTAAAVRHSRASRIKAA